MLHIMFAPFAAYFSMLLTIVMLNSLGYDVKGVDTISVWSAYIQVYVAIHLLKLMKGKINELS